MNRKWWDPEEAPTWWVVLVAGVVCVALAGVLVWITVALEGR